MEDKDNIYIPDDGDIWAGTDPNVAFKKRDQAWEIATGSPMSIWAAAYTGNVNRINKHLEEGVDINSLADGQSPLHFASEGGAIDSVELLISEKANVNLKDDKGDTPLHIAMRKGHLTVFEKLIKSGANPKIKNNLGILPGEDSIEPTAPKKRTETDWVHKASELGDLTKITEFVDEDILDIDINDSSGRTPLHCACIRDMKPVAELLISAGADPDARDCEGMTPLHYTAIWGAFDTAKLLLESVNEFNPLNNRKETPFDLARLKENHQIAAIISARIAKEKEASGEGDLRGMK